MKIQQFVDIADELAPLIQEARKASAPFSGTDFERAVKRAYDGNISKEVKAEIERAIERLTSSKDDRFRKEVGKIVKDALESYAKTMWIKRRFWLNQLDV